MTLKRTVAHKIGTAAEEVQQVVRRTSRLVERAAQDLGLPAGLAAEEAEEARQQVRACMCMYEFLSVREATRVGGGE